MAAKIVWPAATVLAAAASLCAVTLHSDSRALFVPQLKPGQTLLYEVHGRLNRSVKTESRVSSFYGPQQLQGDLSSQIRLTVQKMLAGKPHPIAGVQTELLPITSPQVDSQTAPTQNWPSIS